MDQHSQTQQEEQQFNRSSKSTWKTKSKQKKQEQGKEKGKGKKGGRKESKKEPRKRKQVDKKIQSNKNENVKDVVRQYMQKQNRPYNLLNIYDNLRGSISKKILQATLQQLKDEGVLVSKEFGKVVIYMVNQQKFDINAQQLQTFNSKLTQYRQQCSQLKKVHKQLIDENKKITSTKTNKQLKNQLSYLRQHLTQLQFKKVKLINGVGQRISQQQVLKVQKQKQMLIKQAKKRKKITKQCLKTLSQNQQKKISQLAQIIGVQL